MNASLADRYIAAALRDVPESQRDEIESELRELVGDAVAARSAAAPDRAAAERAALVELGDPARLVAAYLDRPLHLIGPRYYLMWRRLLRLLLVIVVPIVIASVALAQVIASAPVGEIVVNAFGTGFMVAVQLAFWVTVVFALVERFADVDVELGWTPDDLPEVPARSPGANWGDLIASLVFLGLLGGFLAWQIRSPFTTSVDGEQIPVLAPAVESTWLPYWLALVAVEIVFAVLLYLRRGWTWSFAVANLLLNLAFAIPAIWLVAGDRLLNPAFVAAMESTVGWASQVSVTITLLVILAVCAWDVVDGFRKAAYAHRRR